MELIIYRAKNGREPFSRWFDSLENWSPKQLIEARLNRVRAGNFGDCKSLGQGVIELRLHFGSGYRIYFALEGNTHILLLLGGAKAQQKRDIPIAKKLWSDYQREKRGK